MIIGCSDKNENEYLNQPPPNADTGDCLYSMGFIETYRQYIEYDGFFFVKGVITANGSYGMKIKIIEDLKGNYEENSSITLWNSMEGVDQVWKYSQNETLIILMRKMTDRVEDSWTEQRLGDYCTMGCATSILLLSEENVTGVINSDYKKITMPWKELQALLSVCSSKLGFVENYHTNINREDVFYIKGAVVEKPYSYGLKVKLTEDLKGNFSKDSTFVVWGSGDASDCIDRLRWYGFESSTFLMLIKPIVSVDEPYSERKEGDYSTMNCAYSVLRIVNEKVEVEWNKWITMEEFEALLKEGSEK